MKNVSASNDNSPMKAQEKSLNKSKTNNGDKNELMDMIKECSKNIEKIEFRQSNSKKPYKVTSINLDTETPNK